IILTKADKGNIKVALDKDKYVTKMKENIPKNEFFKAIGFCFNSTSHLIIRFKNKNSIHYKPLMSEMIHIKRQINGINLQTDTEFLDKIYEPTLKF
ncbi:hypothetical protein ALC53_02330, partial [Atta colombica]